MNVNYWISEDTRIKEDLRKVLNEFLYSMKLSCKGASTIYYYRLKLEKFLRDFGKSLSELTIDDVHTWLKENARGKKEGTINLIMSIISSFLIFCREEEYVNQVLVKRRWRPKKPQTTPRCLNYNELAKIKMVAEKSSLRNRLIIELLISTGCRCGEIRGLNVQDLDLKNRIAIVTGKGEKVRHVFFSEVCAHLLHKYLAVHPMGISALFINHQKKRLTLCTIQNITKKLGEDAELDHRISPHWFRHTYATNLLSKGADINYISEMLGHTNLKTTKIYTKVLLEDLIRSYRMYAG
ncbi:Tyrosine recombinase XerC [Candidatus Desulfosporosinus infrequens]|uniref:Tyrosine recombinase XerC n=1 Tax=Candidatus Desulfosporosinus infrequens TaxID=2043169 RepID=A0A2U3LLD2_9FIRM|nr:Tyrosine recombinase XerC [Candidatus Desulfosporosinus infrequens]